MKSLILALLVISFSSFAEDGSESMGLGGSKDTSKSEKVSKCANPQAALATTFGSGSERTTCFEKTNYSSRELIIVSEHLGSILKANDVEIDIKNVPTDPRYKDPKNKKERYMLLDNARPIFLHKVEEAWIFPEEVIENINALYKESLKFNVTWFYDWLPSWATQDIFGIAGVNLLQITLLILLLAIALVIRFSVAWVIGWQLGKMLGRMSVHEDDRILRKTGYSVGNLAIAGFLGIFLPGLDFNVHVSHYLILGLRFFAGVSAVILVYRAVDILGHLLYRRALKSAGKMDDQLVPLLGKVLKIIVVVIGSIFVLQNLDVDVTSLLAGVTIGGLAFSFAAKDAVANFFGSVTIFSDKSFGIGDWIKIHNVEGTVEVIGFRSTRIRTFNDSLISMPNSKFTDEVVENFTVRKNRRTSTQLNISYDTTPEQIEAFCNGIRAIIKAHPQTRKDSYEIHFIGYGDTALKIMLNFFTEVKTWTEELRVRHEIYLDIWRLAEKMGVKFAFPHQQIHVHTAETKEPIAPKSPSKDELTKAATYFAPKGEGVIPPGPRSGEGYFPTGSPHEKSHEEK